MPNAGKYRRLAQTLLVTGGAFAINYLIYFFLTPYVTGHLGTEVYGFVTLAKDFTQYALIFTSALNSFAGRYIAIEFHRGERQKANIYFSSTFFGDLLLGGFLFLSGLFLISVLDRIFTIPAGALRDVKLLFALIFIRFFLTTLASVFEVPALIVNRLDLTGIFKALSYASEGLALIVLFSLFPPRASYVGIALLAATLVVIAGNLLIWKKYTPNLLIRRSLFSLRAVRQLVADGLWTSINLLGDALNSGLDLIVTGLLLSSLEMGQVAIAKTVYTMLFGIFVIINPAFQPMFLKSYAGGDRESLLEEMTAAMTLSSMAANISFSGLFALGSVFFSLWLPGQDSRLIWQLSTLNALALVASGSMQPLYYIYTMTLKRKVPCLITLAGGLFNVLGMIVLIRHSFLGVYAVILTTVIVACVIGFITNPLYISHVLQIPKSFLYGRIARNMLSLALMMPLFWVLAKLFAPKSWIGLILCALFDLLPGILLHILVTGGRGSLLKLWRRLFKKK